MNRSATQTQAALLESQATNVLFVTKWELTREQRAAGMSQPQAGMHCPLPKSDIGCGINWGQEVYLGFGP